MVTSPCVSSVCVFKVFLGACGMETSRRSLSIYILYFRGISFTWRRIRSEEVLFIRAVQNVIVKQGYASLAYLQQCRFMPSFPVSDVVFRPDKLDSVRMSFRGVGLVGPFAKGANATLSYFTSLLYNDGIGQTRNHVGCALRLPVITIQYR